MALNITGLMDAVTSHAAATGDFDYVTGHEPKSAPTSGLTAAVWVNRLTAIRTSGLDRVTSLLVFNVRIFSSLNTVEPDAIDPAVLMAVDALLAAYVGDFTLDGLVRQVDVFGAYGPPLDVQAGYVQQGGGDYRVMTISLPLVVDDLWEETA